MSEVGTLQDVVGTILIRDAYLHDRYTYAMRSFVFGLALLAFSAVGNVALMGGKDRFLYLMTDPLGRLMTLVPLDEPNATDEQVAKWAVDALARINTFDFANFRTQFAHSQGALTGVGWENFQSALKESGNFVSVTENRFVTTAVPAGPAVVEGKGIAEGSDSTRRYVWTVKVPFSVVYRNNKQTTEQNLVYTATIVRMPEFINKEGLGIRAIVGRQF